MGSLLAVQENVSRKVAEPQRKKSKEKLSALAALREISFFVQALPAWVWGSKFKVGVEEGIGVGFRQHAHHVRVGGGAEVTVTAVKLLEIAQFREK